MSTHIFATPNQYCYRSAAFRYPWDFVRKHLEAHGLVTLEDSIFNFCIPNFPKLYVKIFEIHKFIQTHMKFFFIRLK